MSNAIELKKGKEFLDIVKKKAQKDKTFREKLINSPRDTIGKMPGIELKDSSIKIIVEDQMNPNIIYLNIPAAPNLNDYELNEEDLNLISGGTSVFGVECAVIAAGAGLFIAGVAAVNLAGDVIDGWNQYHE